MALQTFDFLRAPMVRNDYSGVTNLMENVLKGYYEPKERAQKLEQGAQNLELGKHNIAAKEIANKFLEREKEAGIGLDLARAKALESGQTGRAGAVSVGQRIFSSMPQAARENWLAEKRGLGFDDAEAIGLLGQGWTRQQFIDEAKNRGIDTDNVEKIFAVTNPNITAMQKRQVLSAGSEVLDHFMENAVAPYSQRVLGYSPKLVWDMMKSENEDQVVDFYAARVLEEENAIQNIAKAGGNINMHAVDNMVNKGMGNAKVIPAQMTPAVFRKVKQRARQVLNDAVKAEKDVITRKQEPKRAQPKSEEDMMKSAINKEQLSLHDEENLKILLRDAGIEVE